MFKVKKSLIIKRQKIKLHMLDVLQMEIK